MSYTINPVAYGIYKGQSQKMTGKAIQAHENAGRAWDQVSELKDELFESNNAYSAVLAHYIAKEAEANYLLELLDEVYTTENNPARQKYEDDNFEVPCGTRKGQPSEVRDVVFYNAMHKRFLDETKGLKGYFKSWVDVIRKAQVFE